MSERCSCTGKQTRIFSLKQFDFMKITWKLFCFLEVNCQNHHRWAHTTQPCNGGDCLAFIFTLWMGTSMDAKLVCICVQEITIHFAFEFYLYILSDTGLYLNCNLYIVWKLSHSFCLRFFFHLLPHHHSCSLTSCLVYLFFSRCFDRHGYCSRGWCLDTGWHCTAPWAHSQIREDIRNPSLNASFNHKGWRENMFMNLTVEKKYITHFCVCFISMYVF